VKVSVVATVLNEDASIGALLESLTAQSRPPDEVVLVDGGSQDGTVERIRAYRDRLPLQWIAAPGVNISEGRNIAIRAASGSILACTDAGVRLGANWLAELVSPFLGPSPPQAVSGFYEAAPTSTFEVAMSATVLPRESEIRPESFLPSSRSVAFTRAAWTAAGGYPEWLDYCEDLVFDLRVRHLAGEFAFAPGAVAHFRPRGSLRAFFRQYYLYARGDGKADLWLGRHAIRYASYLLAAPNLLYLGAAFSPWWWAAGGVVGFWGLLGRPYARLMRSWRGLSLGSKLGAALWVPWIRVTGDVAKMCGYPVGLAWRWMRAGSDPRLSWRPGSTDD